MDLNPAGYPTPNPHQEEGCAREHSGNPQVVALLRLGGLTPWVV